MFVWKRPKINENRPEKDHFKKKTDDVQIHDFVVLFEILKIKIDSQLIHYLKRSIEIPWSGLLFAKENIFTQIWSSRDPFESNAKYY